MNELMNEWMNEWIREWMNEWMNERKNEWMNEHYQKVNMPINKLFPVPTSHQWTDTPLNPSSSQSANESVNHSTVQRHRLSCATIWQLRRKGPTTITPSTICHSRAGNQRHPCSPDTYTHLTHPSILPTLNMTHWPLTMRAHQYQINKWLTTRDAGVTHRETDRQIQRDREERKDGGKMGVGHMGCGQSWWWVPLGGVLVQPLSPGLFNHSETIT